MHSHTGRVPQSVGRRHPEDVAAGPLCTDDCRIRCLLLCLLLGLSAISAAAIADSDPPLHAGRLELQALVAEALAANPDIVAAERRLQAARAVVPQARTLPDPVLSFSYEDMDVRETMYGVMQEIPFPGKLRLKGEIAAREAERAEHEYTAIRLAVTARLKEAFYDLALSYQSAAIVDSTREILVQLSQAAEAGYAVGRMAQADAFRAQAEISRNLARRAVVDQEIQSVGAALGQLLNRDPGAPLGEPESFGSVKLRRSAAELVATMETAAPLVQVGHKGVERGDAAIELARREYLPDFAVGVQGIHEEPMNENGYQLMLNVSVPLYYGTKQRYAVREARALRAEASSGLQAVRRELAMRIRDEVARIERAERLIDLLRNAIIPQARLTFDSARSGYTVGRVDFLTMLNSLLTLQENELELHAEIAAHEKARARLEEIIGEAP